MQAETKIVRPDSDSMTQFYPYIMTEFFFGLSDNQLRELQNIIQKAVDDYLLTIIK